MNELIRLHNMLIERRINHSLILEYDNYNNKYDRRYLRLYEYGSNYEEESHRILSAICHYGSYGYEENLIEIMGLLTDEESKYDSVLGHLTAEQVLERILNYKGELKWIEHI